MIFVPCKARMPLEPEVGDVDDMRLVAMIDVNLAGASGFQRLQIQRGPPECVGDGFHVRLLRKEGSSEFVLQIEWVGSRSARLLAQDIFSDRGQMGNCAPGPYVRRADEIMCANASLVPSRWLVVLRRRRNSQRRFPGPAGGVLFGIPAEGADIRTMSVILI